MTDSYEIDLDSLKNDFNRIESKPTNFSDNIVPIPKQEGNIVVRLLPPAHGKRFYCATRLHYVNNKNYHCLKTLEDGKWVGNCPVCNKYNAYWSESKLAKTNEERDALIALARKLKPTEKYYYNAIVRKMVDHESGETKHNVGPLIFPAAKMIQQRILRAIFGNPKADESPLGNIAHPTHGRDFKIIVNLRKTDDGVFPNYDESKFLDISELGTKSQIEDWMSRLHDLQSLRDSQLRTMRELQEQVDIFCGLRDDPSAQFNPTGNSNHASSPSPSNAKNSSLSDDDSDFSMVGDDFINDLKKHMQHN